MDMSVTNASKILEEKFAYDTARGVVLRVLTVSTVTFIFWLGVVGLIMFTPYGTEDPLGKASDAPHEFSVRLAGFILLVHLASGLCIQLLAPGMVIRFRLISNTLFSLLILTMCVALMLVSPVIPEMGVPYVKSAAALAFQPAFIVVNCLVSLLIGTFTYRWRNEPMFDLSEIYWNMGLMLLVGLAIALIFYIVS